MLVFATNNRNKLKEARQILSLPIKSLSDLNRLHHLDFKGDIPETGMTFKQNALQKALFVADNLTEAGMEKEYSVFADDTGLEVEALQGEPSVYSARYANFPPGRRISSLPFYHRRHYASLPVKPFRFNIEKLLTALKPFRTPQQRAACFKTVICLLQGDNEYYFEGRVDGYILHHPQGRMGFGYDCIFCPDGYEKSFGLLTPGEKNAISHRGNALRKMREVLYE
ncbi:MAG: RdgB/HAM1 family non-canonical purine NTP pyrophosphatase [Bacteroidales bacterium]|jgi:XTP/dITP diphosphohydrolase|nr:RdgB/HAM1 family non-canonical purine NTP pyrophosphatase [Bacteroidales bacterium]